MALVRAGFVGWCLRAKVELDRNLAFWIVALLASIVFVAVPQMAHIWSQAQPEGMSLGELAWFYGFETLVISFYVGSVGTVLRPYPLRFLRESAQANWDKGRMQFVFVILSAICWLPEQACRLLPKERACLWREQVGSSNPRLAAVAVGIGVGSFAFGAAGDSSQLYTLAGVFCRNVGLALVFAGAWLARPSATTSEHRIGPLVGRAISWLLITTLAGEAIWLVGLYAPSPASLRLYSIWAMCHIAAAAGLAALLLDRLHSMSTWPLRPLVGIAGVVTLLVFTSIPTRIRPTEAAALAHPRRQPAVARAEPDAAATHGWYRQLLSRIEAVPEKEGPVVLVAASGGGSRAAIFAALALEALCRTPLDDKPMQASKVAGRTFGDNVVLVSSVSGGSLAAAYHAVQRARGKQLEAVALPRNTTQSELISLCLERLRTQLARLDDEGSRPAAQPQAWTASQATTRRARWRESRASLEKQLADLSRGDAPTTRRRDDAARDLESQIDGADQRLALLNAVEWLTRMRHSDSQSDGDPGIDRIAWTLQSNAFDAMCTDFMAPLLRGLGAVVLGRDDALTRFWTEEFGWRGITNVRGYLDRADAPFPLCAPMLVLNASDVGKGRRLAIGFPRLPSQLWRAIEPDDDRPWARLGPIGFDAIAPDFKLALARAVRMSSNFPWAFPVQEIVPESGAKPVHVLDGGVVDSTGLDTLRHLFRTLRWRSQRPRGVGGDGHTEEASKILLELRKRGVLLFEIDAGGKPEDGFVHGIAAGILEPVGALSVAAYTQAERTKRDNIESILGVIRGDPQGHAAGARPGSPRVERPAAQREVAWHIVLQCNHNDAGAERRSDVMTAWSLGPKDKVEILTRFFAKIIEWDRSRKDIANEPRPSGEHAAPSAQERVDKRIERGRLFEQRAIGREAVLPQRSGR